MNDQFVNKTFFKKSFDANWKKRPILQKYKRRHRRLFMKNENEIGFMQIPEIKQRKTDVIKHCSIQWLSNEMAK